VVLGVGALRLAEAVVRKYLPATMAENINHCTLTDKEVGEIHELWKMHARYDGDGKPVWYNQDDPKLQSQIAASIATIAETQRDTLRIVERIDRRSESAG
jgi:hypothetical protein